jgi:radical SAM protein with 4Fe4S-binding SPASM domain
MLTTNGTLFSEKRIEQLLVSGLDRLTVSIDGDEQTHERIRGISLDEIRAGLLELKRRRDAGRHALRIDVSMVLDDQTRPAIEHYRAAWKGLADRVQVIPRLAERPRTRPCRELWRGSLVVLVDGTVTACCADSEGALQLGNAFEEDPARILNGPAFQELRRCHRRREFPEPCRNCSEYDGSDVHVSPRFE